MDQSGVRFHGERVKWWSQKVRTESRPGIGWVDNREPNASSIRTLEISEPDCKGRCRLSDLCDPVEEKPLVDRLFWIDQRHMRRNPCRHHGVPLDPHRLKHFCYFTAEGKQDMASGRFHLALLAQSLEERPHCFHEPIGFALMDPVTRINCDHLAVGEDASRLCQHVIVRAGDHQCW